MKCTSLLLPPSSIPSYPYASNGFCVVPLPPPPVPSVDSRRLLISTARRRETSAARDRWRHHQQQQQQRTTSRYRHPRSAPPATTTSSQSALLDLRQRLAAHGYGTDSSSSDDSDTPRRKSARQFPRLEQEVRKRNLTPRLPYYVKVEVEEEERMDYPSHHPSSSQTLFSTAWGAGRPSSPTLSVCPRARLLRRESGERFFIHPEWASESVGWQRFQHHSNPARFRHSWI